VSGRAGTEGYDEAVVVMEFATPNAMDRIRASEFAGGVQRNDLPPLVSVGAFKCTNFRGSGHPWTDQWQPQKFCRSDSQFVSLMKISVKSILLGRNSVLKFILTGRHVAEAMVCNFFILTFIETFFTNKPSGNIFYIWIQVLCHIHSDALGA
jgi:hypothetical protein